MGLTFAGLCALAAPDGEGGQADGQAKADTPVAYVGARIYTVVGPVIERGVLLVHRGKLVAVGAEGQVQIPAGATVLNLAGKTIIPGLVDTHSHIGIFGRPGVQANADGNELTGPVQPGLRALDAVNPDDPGIRMALAGGITTANIMPGSGSDDWCLPVTAGLDLAQTGDAGHQRNRQSRGGEQSDPQTSRRHERTPRMVRRAGGVSPLSESAPEW